MLACAVPSGGRILEIGTGVGVGTAWITAGLRERIDVEVISVEIDLVLSNAAKKSPWPSYVKITANALDVLGKLGTFNLVFVDAAPIKYGHISSVLRILRPGGLLMTDDLEATVPTSEVEQTAQSSKQDAFRHSLLHHPELNVVEMEWSTGVILATKSMHASSYCLPLMRVQRAGHQKLACSPCSIESMIHSALGLKLQPTKIFPYLLHIQ